VTIQELGSIGEFVAALATIATIAYLAVQVRQNTRALRSSTFQDLSGGMNKVSEAIATHPDLSMLMVKGSDGLALLTSEEQVRFNFLCVMAFRRFEAVFTQRSLGNVEAELTAGFERSLLSIVASGGGAEWWETGKPAFNTQFVEFVDRKLASERLPRIHLNFGGSD
jgi:hypothetical protein